ncbi:MAG TPA: hypothetical protein VMZ11_05375 [Mycobacteriales bacterium]|nr:hypothetical protein [Mycobacteriales bacterium]
MRRAAVGAVALVLAVAAPALGSFRDTAKAASTLATTQLAAPTGLTAVAGCNLVVPKVTLSWTATTTTFATGYDVYRGVGAGTQTLLTTLSPRTVTSYVDNTVALLTSYTYSVRTRFASWSKASSNASASTPVLCL